MNVQWINSRGATLVKCFEQGKLWVVDCLPIVGKGSIDVWEADAEQGDIMYHLFGKWAQNHIYELPRAAYARETKFMETLQEIHMPLTLVVHDAHLLRGNVLDAMRLFAEFGVMVVLVGDVSKINVLTNNYPGFYQRASYCVAVTDLF